MIALEAFFYFSQSMISELIIVAIPFMAFLLIVMVWAAVHYMSKAARKGVEKARQIALSSPSVRRLLSLGNSSRAPSATSTPQGGSGDDGLSSKGTPALAATIVEMGAAAEPETSGGIGSDLERPLNWLAATEAPTPPQSAKPLSRLNPASSARHAMAACSNAMEIGSTPRGAGLGDDFERPPLHMGTKVGNKIRLSKCLDNNANEA